jgi:hypothetical protein
MAWGHATVAPRGYDDHGRSEILHFIGRKRVPLGQYITNATFALI